MTVPAFFALTTPFDETLTIFELLDFHRIFSDGPLTVAFSVVFESIFNVFSFGKVILTFLTIILHIAVSPFIVAVIIAVPAFFALTFPFELTLAIRLLLDFQDTLFFFTLALTSNCTVFFPFSYIITLFLFKLILFLLFSILF